jgi:hypothetical protein
MFQALLARLSEVFEKSKIPYMVIGGQAVLVYGEPRFTKTSISPWAPGLSVWMRF